MTKAPRQLGLELAGMIPIRPVRHFAHQEVTVPREAELRDNCLIYNTTDTERKRISDGWAVVNRFVDLCRHQDDSIRQFALKYGVLGLDEDGTPAVEKRFLESLLGRPYRGFSGREPLVTWRYYSGAFGALLSIAANLHQGRPGTHADWALVTNSKRSQKTYQFPREFTDDKYMLVMAVGEYVLNSNLRPMLEWPEGSEPRISFGFLGVNGLYDVLLFHVMLAIARTDALQICAACQSFFVSVARARRGTVRFCEHCRDSGEAARISALLYRKRRKGE